ncbi:MAG: CpaF family protein [Chloroflexi bacterium]|nr:MAG: CpaF family protein [Chloroflexota bacterium]
MVNASEVSQDELARYYEALGPIRDLVLDDSLTEVMVNGHDNVYVERSGKILLTDRKFDDENHLLRVIDFIVSAVGRRIDFRTPMVDARLLDGSRVNAVISPIALDGPKLQLHQEHVCRMESRPPDLNGENRVGIRDLVINALRMRPDRIVVGECRAGEALDMLQAMNTGHDGSLTTLHANTTRDALSRLETMVLMAGIDLPTKAIRQQVASAIDLIVQLSRTRDGQRKVTSITEITGMEGDTITMQEIFLYESHGVGKDGVMTGVFRPTGIRPHIMDKLFGAGVPIPPELARVFPDRRNAERPAH